MYSRPRTDRATEIWLEVFSYSRDHGILIGQAEAAQKVASLYNQTKKPEDALKYYAIAVDLLRKLNSDAALHEVEVYEAIVLVNAQRGKDALPLLDRLPHTPRPTVIGSVSSLLSFSSGRFINRVTFSTPEQH
jgi:hypothetical protein